MLLISGYTPCFQMETMLVIIVSGRDHQWILKPIGKTLKQDICMVSKNLLMRYLLMTKAKIVTLEEKIRHYLDRMIKVNHQKRTNRQHVLPNILQRKGHNNIPKVLLPKMDHLSLIMRKQQTGPI